MRTLRFCGLLTVVLMSSLVCAWAAASASMSVRVEGVTSTLLPRTPVAATGVELVKFGGTCGGATAAAALDRATAGDWDGTWYDGFGDYGIDAIKGQAFTYSDPYYWGFFVNGTAATVGICQQPVQEGDEAVFAPIPNSAGDFSVTLLDLSIPAAIRAGVAFTASVTEAANDFVGGATAGIRRGPAAGAQIALPGGGSATTGADGTARITLTTVGVTDLRATRDGSTPSATIAACVTTGYDGRCGTVADRRAPHGRIATLRDGRRYPPGAAPRLLRGMAATDASGLRRVQLRLTRRVPANAGGDRRCETYDVRQERWLDMRRCGAERGHWFTVGDRAAWSYLLPAALKGGRYVLDVRLTDAAGNASRYFRRAADPSKIRNRVVFFVG
ncbi:unannotated protein [freshwater metagenome]|uniref:Unannotated protein n=1 Tax=freshwater metagenome TaxID=449393 RepID=A0A6J7CZV5_9ZZZZ|nr:DUF4430 domain-containing protein [Actinomycetota bacterium]